MNETTYNLMLILGHLGFKTINENVNMFENEPFVFFSWFKYESCFKIKKDSK